MLIGYLGELEDFRLAVLICVRRLMLHPNRGKL